MRAELALLPPELSMTRLLCVLSSVNKLSIGGPEGCVLRCGMDSLLLGSVMQCHDYLEKRLAAIKLVSANYCSVVEHGWCNLLVTINESRRSQHRNVTLPVLIGMHFRHRTIARLNTILMPLKSSWFLNSRIDCATDNYRELLA